MLLTLSETLLLDASPDEVWKLLRDTPRFAHLLPGVDNVAPLPDKGAEAYSAAVTDKVGPFKVTFRLEVGVEEAREPSFLQAGLKGVDPLGLNRITGSLRATLSPAPEGTRLQFEASVEILGKLATLGAVPIRRKTAQSFADFAKNIQGQFAKEPS